jgi:hypothetical protein
MGEVLRAEKPNAITESTHFHFVFGGPGFKTLPEDQ